MRFATKQERQIENKKMRKGLMTFLLMLTTAVSAFGQAEIKFAELTHNFGTFSEDNATQKTTFTFTNVGDAPLIINQATASCGCTVPEYTKKPILPGKTGTITVTYNGKYRFPGHFKKTITVRTNGKVEMTRLYIEGNMLEKK